MITVGVDPDTHFSSIAFFDDGKPIFVFVGGVPKRHRGTDAVVRTVREFIEYAPRLPNVAVDRICIEGQQLYKRQSSEERKAKPQDLFRLANISGAVAYELMQRYPSAKVFIPLPQEWKGSVPKKIHQNRIRAKVDAANPEFLKAFSKSVVSHIIDACGMALWVAQKRVLTASEIESAE